MSKQCAKCEKTVYPIEELKCLDKVWHKACFKCWTCGMTLNMKNYKGYDKKPYCGAHYPKTSFTAVTETPEMARLAQQTKLQSQVEYHKNHEADKTKFTVIADDPETKRLLKNSEKTSLVSYHSEFEKSKGNYTLIEDDPELLRLKQNTQNSSLVKYHEEFERNMKGVKTSVTDDPEMKRVKKNTAISSEIEYRGVREKQADQETRRGNVMHDQGPNTRPAPGSISNYNPMPVEQPNQPSPYSARGQGHQVYNSTTTGAVRRSRISSYHEGRTAQRLSSASDGRFRQRLSLSSLSDVEPRPARNVGSISDYDPGADVSPQNYQQAKQWQESVPDPQSPRYSTPEGRLSLQRLSISSAAQQFGYAANGSPQPTVPMIPLGQNLNVTVSQPRHEAGVGDYYPAPQQQAPPPQQPPQQQAPPPQATGQRFRCVYDYSAGDNDEVSFVEEDVIVNPDPIDDGWMYGTVLRTGQRGMLPANYVEPIS